MFWAISARTCAATGAGMRAREPERLQQVGEGAGRARAGAADVQLGHGVPAPAVREPIAREWARWASSGPKCCTGVSAELSHGMPDGDAGDSGIRTAWLTPAGGTRPNKMSAAALSVIAVLRYSRSSTAMRAG